ncbi:MAG: proline dehydrogenase family protein [Candidatus Eremiobacteraeota bacterium]|nr:proline dehydrogenase family protein [Candidatus Eremiobacteraeota bacterium]
MTLLDRPLRYGILAAADNAYIRKLVMRHGMRLGAARFVAGETTQEFLTATKRANERGFAVAAGILGEGTASSADARKATDHYCELLDEFSKRGLDANVALKPTHLGLDIDRELALGNLSQVAEHAARNGNFMRLDMEQSTYVDPTLDLYRSLRERFENVGCVLQSYLHRSLSDLEQLAPLHPNVRIVKGAYLELPQVAYPNKADVDRNYIALAEFSLRGSGYTAIATHDIAIIEHLAAFASEIGLPKQGRFEFQMLYGVCNAFAQTLVERGYRMRLAIPFGQFWFPYLMRRLAERPANLGFFLKSVVVRG